MIHKLWSTTQRGRSRPMLLLLVLAVLVTSPACATDASTVRAATSKPAAAPPLVRTGMDPGMTRRLAATLYPVSRSYTEFCPDSPSGKCNGTLKSGDRFYTLAANMSGPTIPMSEDKTQCRIGTRELVLTNNGPTACPYHFAWKRTAAGRPLASVSIDTTGFPTTQDAYAYFGLQENVGTAMGHLATGRPSGEIYAGIPAAETDAFRPRVADLERLDVDIRGRLCLGRHAADANYGRIAVYVLWYDSVTGKGRELSIDLMTYKAVPKGTDVPLGEYFFEEQAWYHKRGGPAPSAARWVGHIDGPMWGVVPKALQLQRDTTKELSLIHI